MSKSSPRAKRLSSKTVLQIVTGSIAAYKTPDLVKMMKEDGAKVICVQTDSSRKFVTETVLRTVTGERVYSDLFPNETPWGVMHTSLADLADVILIAPASANFIAKLAHGIADDLGTCVCLATRRPILIAPAMNDHMYTHPLTQRNMAQLKAIGYRFVDPVEGDLACGRTGVGHIAPLATILESLVSVLKTGKKSK
ncbi:MAG: Coenzyme A biosynthesis bifunctional protein CoaBC [Candidatus Omnitrophica bacterium ADurb.Bin292]|jgi:phosphopantothenoylcysteine decarboxylase/phosphopantothenate--cysteine ligase|nr:MAG: Coenzyme A biosynthesis bifunctional protein CoaBC [Candidatus Omnitrophica bacterium ADurb.Bin292]HOG23865.1 flavoprotein [Candidatus Omnitrophota bacterium]